MDAIDGAFFAFSALSAVWFAFLLLVEGARPGWQSLLLVVFWAFVAYLLLPRVHRILTHIYLPGYFIGRARTSDGRLGDPINLAWRGREAQVHATMRSAGWIRADELDLSAGRRIVTSTIRRRSYAGAPVSPLMLFDRQQDFAYEREVDGTPSQRHHVRFWRCPDGWRLPGGFAVDWLAAATYDRSVGVSTFTLQITHKIAEDIDTERDFLVRTVTDREPRTRVSTIEDFSTGYHARNGGGDLIATDGDLPVIDVRAIVAPDTPDATTTDSRSRLPAPTVVGAGLVGVRAIAYIAAFVIVALSPDWATSALAALDAGLSAADVRGVVVPVTVVLAVVGTVDLLLATGVVRASNLARLLLMSVCVVATVTAYATYSEHREVITLTHLPTVGVNILVLLALSSSRARAYATHGMADAVGAVRTAG